MLLFLIICYIVYQQLILQKNIGLSHIWSAIDLTTNVSNTIGTNLIDAISNFISWRKAYDALGSYLPTKLTSKKPNNIYINLSKITKPKNNNTKNNNTNNSVNKTNTSTNSNSNNTPVNRNNTNTSVNSNNSINSNNPNKPANSNSSNTNINTPLNKNNTNNISVNKNNSNMSTNSNNTSVNSNNKPADSNINSNNSNILANSVKENNRNINSNKSETVKQNVSNNVITSKENNSIDTQLQNSVANNRPNNANSSGNSENLLNITPAVYKQIKTYAQKNNMSSAQVINDIKKTNSVPSELASMLNGNNTTNTGNMSDNKLPKPVASAETGKTEIDYNKILSDALNNILLKSRTSNFDVNDYQKQIEAVKNALEVKAHGHLSKSLELTNRKQLNKLSNAEMNSFVEQANLLLSTA